MKFSNLLLFALSSVLSIASGVAGEAAAPEALPSDEHMFVIERVIPGAGALTTDQLKGISQTSCSVLREMGSGIKWVHSYVTGDKIYCVYLATSADLIREHAMKGGFPADSVSEVKTIISPKTAE